MGFDRHGCFESLQVVDLFADIGQQLVGQIHAQAVAHDDALHGDGGQIGRQRIRRYQPALGAQSIGEVVEVPRSSEQRIDGDELPPTPGPGAWRRPRPVPARAMAVS
jgi:hypothetical protein